MTVEVPATEDCILTGVEPDMSEGLLRNKGFREGHKDEFLNAKALDFI